MLVRYLKRFRILLFSLAALFVGAAVLIWNLGFTVDLLRTVCAIIIVFGLPIALFPVPLGRSRPPS